MVHEIELAGLHFLIDSPYTSQEEKAKAAARREAITVEWGRAMTELEDARSGFARPLLSACVRRSRRI